VKNIELNHRHPNGSGVLDKVAIENTRVLTIRNPYLLTVVTVN